MKILHVCALDAKTAWLKWIAAESGHFDLVCIAGNTLNLDGDTWQLDPAEQVATVLTLLRAIHVPLAVCSGPKDFMEKPGFEYGEWMRELRKLNIRTDDDVFWFRDFLFRCVPWCAPVPDEPKDDIWLMHAPPYGARTGVVEGGESFGSKELRDLCLQGRGPLYVLGGMGRQSLGFWGGLHHTISLCPGQGSHPTCPNHVVLDLDQHTISHHAATLQGVTVTTVALQDQPTVVQ